MSLIETDLQQPTSVSAWLVELVADCLEVPACEIDRQVPLVRYGLDSVSAVHLTTAIADELRCDVPEWLLLDHPDIDSVARYIATARTTRQPVQARKIGQSSLDQMLADSVLPDDVRPERAFQASRTVRTVLLTGATGFLGAYLLRSLLRTKSARVYCLVRPDGHADSRTRIQKNLETKGIWEPSFASRVFAIDGDLLKPEMGLTADRFKDLCRDVDEIFHCAAAVNWVFPYAALRDVNVLGTLELLRLACCEEPKRFHFVSSMAVCYSTCGPEEVAEWDDMLPYLKGIHLGYAQSKCVAEALVRRADERGLPVAIYRPSLICGDGQLGVSNTNDFLSSVIKGCIQMGSAPDLDWSLDCCPVDYAADAIVGLSEVSRGSLGVYHVANPSKRHWRELVLWMNLFGYPIKLLSYRNWLAQLQAESTAPEHPLHQLRNFFLTKPREANGVTLPEIYEDGRRSRVSAKRTRKSLSALSFACPPLDAPLLNRYFDSYIDQGFLSPVAGGDRDSRVTPANRLNHDFFRDILCDYYRDHTIRIRGLSTLPLPSQNSIITELTSWRNGTAAGLSRHRVLIEANNQIVPKSLDLVVKIKPKDHEVLEVGERVAALCGDEVGQAFARFKHRTDAAGSHLREIAIYNQQDDRFVKHVPLVFGAVRNDERHDWILVLESLTGFELMDSAADVSGWQRQHHEAAVRGIAEVHAIWYRRERELLAQSWLGPSMSAAWMAEMADLWTALADHSDRYFSDWIGPDIRRLQQHLISTVGQWWQSLETMPRTLIHNDFNPRNIAFRRTENGLRLCAYDWELATIGVPQHDLAELLCFSLTPAVSRNEVLHLVELHRSALQQATGRRIDAESWRLGFQLSLCDLILNRFPMYCLVHTFRRQQFLQRVIKTWRRVYDVVSAGEAIDRSNTRLSTR